MAVIKVSDMMCMHCVATISKALDAAGVPAQVKLEDKTVTVDDAAVSAAVAAISAAGYDAKEA